MSNKNSLKILFVCYGNVARSQMAEAFYNKYTNSSNAKSAGVGYAIGERHQRPAADVIKAMSEEGIDVSMNRVKAITPELVSEADRIIVMCDLDDCPKYLLDSGKFEHISVADPYNLGIEFTRAVRDDIKRLVLDLIHSD